jgi:N-acetylneuraminic acid mutarotase
MLSRPAFIIASGLGLATACSPGVTEPATSSPTDGGIDAAVASNSWITRAALPGTERTGLTTAVVPNAAGERILYAIGGSSSLSDQPTGITTGGLTTVQAWNASTNTWTNRAPLPIDLYMSNGAVTIGGKIYVSGGRNNGDKNFVQSLYVYNPATNKWTRKTDMPFASWGGVSGAVGGKLYVIACGGEEQCDAFERLVVLRYDPATDRWTILAVTPNALGQPLGGVVNGKFYVTGGPDGALMMYDPASDTWTPKAKLPKHRLAGAAATAGGKLYVIGGYEVEPAPDFGRTLVRKTSVYDPATNTWSEKAPLPSDRILAAASRITVGGVERIDLVGGARPGNHLHYVP